MTKSVSDAVSFSIAHYQKNIVYTEESAFEMPDERKVLQEQRSLISTGKAGK